MGDAAKENLIYSNKYGSDSEVPASKMAKMQYFTLLLITPLS